MTRPCPYTPLSTPLSGSARQAEARIRNLFQGPKRRPPVWLMALTLLLIFSCGGLVTCRTAASPPPEEGAPVFSLTTPGEESVPFSDLLGFSGTAIHTVREDLSDWYEYQIRLPDGTSFSLADTSGLMYHLDLDGDGHPDLLAHDPDGGWLLVWRRWPDGSVRSQNLRQAAAELLGLEGTPWELVALTFHPQDEMVSIRSAADPSQILLTLPLSQLLEAACGGNILLASSGQQGEDLIPLSDTLPFGTYAVFWEGLDLDGTGGTDDSVTVFSYDDDSASGPLTVVEAALGTGEVLTWELPSTGHPRLLPASFTPSGLQSVVLVLEDRYSNYGAASCFVLAVEEGALTEQVRLGTWEDNADDLAPDCPVIWSAYLHTRPDGLQVLRVPILYDKWHQPEWATLSWTQAGWDLTRDGYLTDTETVTVGPGRTLTLALRCPIPAPDDSSQLRYDQIQVLDGGTLLQTITPDSFTPDSRAAFQGFVAFSPLLDYVDVRDIDFDGSEDFGVLCDTTHNEAHCWFVWDEASGSFRYLTTLGGRLEVLPETGQLVEGWWTDGPEPVYHALAYNSRGELVLVPSQSDGLF
ncbi:hypothetical protein NE584_05475 [Clostridium sp. DFI.5.61]|uniref:hypothetical protein n=1 Tax=Clostridium sp. DFI.5.61 TaxID=2965279 RepID=UPI00210DC393|nr:hypothetical protein [Clostridium sp. DFI.5.61]MCB5925038.1 hypothetical protein [bacterium 210820-DFI.5.26]MCQ5158488.1 hypothetical protein [Clostridium sp. DFI.5.61]